MRLPWYTSVSHASRAALSAPRDWFAFAAIAFSIFSAFILLPVVTTPGNDVVFQLSIMKPDVYALMIALALLNALLISMQLHIRRVRKAAVAFGEHAKHATTAAGIITSSFLSTIACASCYSSVLALFGLGGTIFLVTHRWWFAAGAIALTFAAIVYASRRINRECNTCTI